MAIDKNKIIARAQELAELVFSGYKKTSDAHLEGLTENGKLNWLKRKLDEVQKIIENMPEFLSSTDRIEAMIIYDEEKPELTNNRFREWYMSYANLKKKYTSFISDIEPFESLYFREDILHAEYLFETDFKKNIIYGLENPYVYELGILTSKVWIVLIAFRKLQIIKEDYFCQLIRQIESPVKGTGLNNQLSIDQKTKLFKALIHIDKGYISSDTREENFIAALTPTDLPFDFKPIKIMVLNKKGVSMKTFLWSLIDAINAETTKKKIENVFCDKQNKPFEIGSRRKDVYYDGYHEEIKSFFK